MREILALEETADDAIAQTSERTLGDALCLLVVNIAHKSGEEGLSTLISARLDSGPIDSLLVCSLH